MYKVKIFWTNKHTGEVVRLNANITSPDELPSSVGSKPEKVLKKAQGMVNLPLHNGEPSDWVYKFESLSWSPNKEEEVA